MISVSAYKYSDTMPVFGEEKHDILIIEASLQMFVIPGEFIHWLVVVFYYNLMPLPTTLPNKVQTCGRDLQTCGRDLQADVQTDIQEIKVVS